MLGQARDALTRNEEHVIVIAQNPKSGTAENDKSQLREAQLRGGSPEQLHASTIRLVGQTAKYRGVCTEPSCPARKIFVGDWVVNRGTGWIHGSCQNKPLYKVVKA